MTKPYLGWVAPRESRLSSTDSRDITNTPFGILTFDRAGGCNGRDALCVNAGRTGVCIPPANFVPGAVFSSDHGIV